ncbi:P-loop containing nucleoside triphosphate hydrolase protein [Atractiella rhizophila]|nr:P-loop containing nucleoside triphosphate hydrolase protein [Atractiella rhizophila]
MSTPAIVSRLSRIKHILLVLSGKGGVGKSSISVQICLSLLHLHPSSHVALLDVDLTGPSIPRMLSLTGEPVYQSTEGWVPVKCEVPQDVKEKGGKLEVMSLGFLIKDGREGGSVVWRGPKKGGMIEKFLGEVRWGEADWLVIDTPPGTSDEHISLLEYITPLLNPSLPSAPTLHSVLVTTPQSISLLDVSKELNFCRRVQLPVLGLVENMSGYVCPHCGEIVGIFGTGGGEDFCKKDEEGLRYLGRVPIERELGAILDGSDLRDKEKPLLERYRGTNTFPIFIRIAETISGLIRNVENA